jgi:kumamolisin
MGPDDRVPLQGSERAAADGALVLGAVPEDEPVRVTVLVRRREELPDDVLSGERRLGVDELRANYGADPAEVSRVVDVLTSTGAQVLEQDAGSRRIVALGAAGPLARLFGTNLEAVESTSPTGQRVRHRQRTGPLSVPAELGGIVTAVLGLDDRPQARPHLRTAAPEAVKSSFTPNQVADLYDFPPGGDGTGQTVGVIELGGGYAESDLTSYFAKLDLSVPNIRAVSVDGATNAPGGDQGADGEVALDIEVIGAVAPKATQLVYFTPNTDAGFHDGVAEAVHASPTPVAISISWGQSEDSWTPQGRDALNEAIADAVAIGITVTAAAGDNGSSDGVSDGQPHVDFPASSPYALGCGGTRLDADAAAIVSEVVWDDAPGGGATGGGVSDVYPTPAWQQAVAPKRAGDGAPGRGVPDVSGDASPETGYLVMVGGSEQVIGGTSAVAPLWAALTARMAQSLGHAIGLFQPALYTGVAAGASPPGFRDITSGSNGSYSAGPGWDPCSGLGSPDGSTLLERIRSSVT